MTDMPYVMYAGEKTVCDIADLIEVHLMWLFLVSVGTWRLGRCADTTKTARTMSQRWLQWNLCCELGFLQNKNPNSVQGRIQALRKGEGVMGNSHVRKIFGPHP